MWEDLVAGACAGLVSRFAVYPADTVKARLQLRGAISPSTLNIKAHAAVLQLARQEGVQGFYKGFSVVLVGVVPANMAYFGGYEAAKAVLPGEDGPVRNLAVGASAQLLAGLVYAPVDIVKERLQVQSMARLYEYRGAAHAVLTTVRSQGMAGLFRGYWVSNAVWVPWNMAYITLYEAARQQQCRWLACAAPDDLPAWSTCACAACAASVACVATQPVDVLKTRLQVLSADVGAGRLTARGVLAHMLATEGPQALLAGMTTRILSIAPGCAISWMLYGPLKQWLHSRTAA